MPISSENVARDGESRVHSIGARWTVAYAAGVEDLAPTFLDTCVRPDVLAHRLFPARFSIRVPRRPIYPHMNA